MDTAKFKKLPKWAQSEFNDLQRKLGHAELTAEKLLDKQKPSRVCFDHYSQPKFIQSDSVFFRVAENNTIEVSLKENHIEVRAIGMLSDILKIVPGCSNTIYITACDWRERHN